MINVIYLFIISLGNMKQREKKLDLNNGIERAEAVTNGIQLLEIILRDNSGRERPEMSGRVKFVVEP